MLRLPSLPSLPALAAHRPATIPQHIPMLPLRHMHRTADNVVDIPRQPVPAAMPDLSRYVDEATVQRRCCLTRLASGISAFFRAPAPAPTIAPGPLPQQWRPVDPTFQHLAELIDGIGNAPESSRHELAVAITARLRRVDMRLPPVVHSPSQTLCVLLSPTWRDAIGPDGLNIADLLGALHRVDEVEAPFRAELRIRLMTAVELTIGHLAKHHNGVRSLDTCGVKELRPLQDSRIHLPESDARMLAFKASAARLIQNLSPANATAGQLATCLLHCLRQNRNIPRDEEAALIGQVAPAIEALIHSDPAARRMADSLRTAAQRLENCFQVASCADLSTRNQEGPGPGGLLSMTPHMARRFLLGRLLTCALDPAVLDTHLRSGEISQWMHPAIIARPQSQETRDAAMAILRQTTRLMLDVGLIDKAQRHALMHQARSHLKQPAAAAAD